MAKKRSKDMLDDAEPCEFCEDREASHVAKTKLDGDTLMCTVCATAYKAGMAHPETKIVSLAQEAGIDEDDDIFEVQMDSRDDDRERVSSVED